MWASWHDDHPSDRKRQEHPVDDEPDPKHSHRCPALRFQVHLLERAEQTERSTQTRAAMTTTSATLVRADEGKRYASTRLSFTMGR